MNNAYAGRLLREGKLPCFIIATILFTLDLVSIARDDHPQLFKAHPASFGRPSLSEIAFGLIILSLPCLVVILSVSLLRFRRGENWYLRCGAPGRCR